MSKLKFGYDEALDLCVWKDFDDPIAFTEEDILSIELREGIHSVLYGELNKFSYQRDKYGDFTVKVIDEKYQLRGEKGYYICSAEEVKDLLQILENIDKNFIGYTDGFELMVNYDKSGLKMYKPPTTFDKMVGYVKNLF